jgi:hypothetical protein
MRRSTSVRRFAKWNAVAVALLGILVSVGVSGCIVAAPGPPAYVVPAPVYVAPAPVYVAPAPVVVWRGGWYRRW